MQIVVSRCLLHLINNFYHSHTSSSSFCFCHLFQEPVDIESVERVRAAIFGEALHGEMIEAYAALQLLDKAETALQYSEMEAVMLCAYILRGVVSRLDDK